jgi:hypothetical protein
MSYTNPYNLNDSVFDELKEKQYKQEEIKREILTDEEIIKRITEGMKYTLDHSGAV